MSHLPLGEKIVETRTCTLTGTEFVITDKDKEFYEKVSPVFGGKKYLIPFPTLCPEARQQRRLAWRQERRLFKRKCDFSGKEIIAMFTPDAQHTVYEESIWLSDAWDPLQYGQDWDETRSFFEQLQQLLMRVPFPSKSTVSGENSDYSNNCGYLKNCYLCFNADSDEDCYYGNTVYYSQNCVDTLECYSSTHCYDCTDAHDCHNVRHSLDVRNCRDSEFLTSCIGCSNCFGCVNSENLQYGFFNTVLSEKEYTERVATFKSLPREQRLSEIAKHRSQFPNIAGRNTLSENISGKRISYCQNVYESRDTIRVKRWKYLANVLDGEDVMDYDVWGNSASRVYESIVCGNRCESILFSAYCYDDVARLLYCTFCLFNSQDCFGCVGLKNKRYCILNKQYTKEEYESLVPRILERMIRDREWWEFVPAHMSPWWYNETIAQDLFPLEKAWTEKALFNWSDYEPPFPSVEKVIPGEKLPDTIQDVPDDVLNWAIKCETSWKLFKIVQPELEFYRKHSLPLPRKHPDVRHSERLAKRSA